jgi:PAS domain S-box-containing protein
MSERARRKRWWGLVLGGGSLLIGLVLTALAVTLAQRRAVQDGQVQFERQVDKLELEVEARYARVLSAFKGLKGYFDAAPRGVNRDSFRIWVASRRIQEDLPGIRGLGFIAHVQRSELPAFLAAERADFAPGYQVRTEGDAPDLYVIRYIEPLAHNEQAWGYDIGSEPVRRAMAETAMATGQPTLTRRITLVQDGHKRPGYLYGLPVFHWATRIDNPVDRARNFVGLIYAPIVMAEFLQGVGVVADEHIDLQVFDGDRVDAAQLVFGQPDGAPGAIGAGPDGGFGRYVQVRHISVGGQALTLRLRSMVPFDQRFLKPWGQVLLAVAGVLLSMLVSSTIWLLLLGRQRAEQLAQRMTADLSQAKQRAEAALRDNTALLDSLQRFHLMSVADPKGRILEVNDAFCAITGYPRADLIGQGYQLIDSHRHGDAFWRGMWETVSRGEPWEGEVCNRAKGGRLYWVKSVIAPLRDADGKVSRYVSICTDITRHKDNERRLNDMAERYQLAIDGGNDGLWDWINVQNPTMWWSPQFYRLIGHEPDAFPASLDAFDALVHPSERGRSRQRLTEALKQTHALDDTFLLRTGGGDYRWFRCRGKVFLNDRGKAQRMAGSIQDVHDHRVAEQLIREQSERLGAVFALSPDGFVSFTVEGRVSDVNPAFTRLTGLSAERVIGLDEVGFVDLLCSHAQSAPAARDLRALLDSPDRQETLAWQARHRLVLAWREPADRMLAFDLQEARGLAVSRVLLVRDVTLEAEVDRAKSSFLSMAAHELRTPMSSIYGFIELLLTREYQPQRRQDLLNKVHRQCEVMVSIINELLDLARIEHRRGADFQVETVDLAGVVGHVCHDFQPPQGRAAPMLGQPAQARSVRADPNKLGQAFLNLLANAYKYSPQGGPVQVRFPQRTDEQGRLWLGIAVEDHGIGMTAEQLAHLGERFFRVDKSGNIPGTGLGVSIVQEIMALMGGTVTVDSEAGRGSVFTLWLQAQAEPVQGSQAG